MTPAPTTVVVVTTVVAATESELAIKPLARSQAAFLIAGWRVRGPGGGALAVPWGRPVRACRISVGWRGTDDRAKSSKILGGSGTLVQD